MKKKNYVYVYLDPRKQGNYSYMENGIGIYFDHEPFYIGEGQKGRMYDHLKEAKNLKINNPKVQKIRKIWKSGLKPIIYKIFEFENEQDALNVERALGFIVGRKNIKEGPLTNLVDLGQKSTRPSQEAKLKRKQLYIDDPDKKNREVAKANKTRANKTDEENQEKIARYQQTLKNNPSINTDKGIKIHENHLNNPEIKKNGAKKRLENETREIKDLRISTYKETLKNDPSINERRGKNISKTIQDTPENIKQQRRQARSEARNSETEEQKQTRTENLYLFYEKNPEKKKAEAEKQKKTKKDNPEICINAGIKCSQTRKDNPEIGIEAGKKISKAIKIIMDLKYKCIDSIKANNIDIAYSSKRESLKYWLEIESKILKVGYIV